MKTYDVCIIGGGAAGLSAAASLDHDIHVCLLEKNEIPGRKIMATGGGRCNITNAACAGKDMALEFFKSLGLETYCDQEGRYYPYSNQAVDVVKVLTGALKGKSIDVKTSFSVEKAMLRNGSFVVEDAKGRRIKASKLLLASGGKAAPQMGTTGDGYAIARFFGHRIEKLYPILTGIQCGSFSDIKGVRARGKAALYKDGQLLQEETGEIQFTEDGISGICVMNLTLYIKSRRGERLEEALQRYVVELDLAPDFSAEELAGRDSSFGILCDRLSARVGMDQLKGWRLPVKGVKGWKNAQCTGGGVSLEEIHPGTMESKLMPGLYFAGEIVDVQGPCGGYNLQNAWETGIKAAGAINADKRGSTEKER